jgi:hypothetical protein
MKDSILRHSQKLFFFTHFKPWALSRPRCRTAPAGRADLTTRLSTSLLAIHFPVTEAPSMAAAGQLQHLPTSQVLGVGGAGGHSSVGLAEVSAHTISVRFLAGCKVIKQLSTKTK